MISERLQAGLEALRNGRKRDARRIFGDLIREEPDHAAAWWYLAAVLDDPEQKVHCLRQVLRLEPDHQEARQLLAALQPRVARPTPPRGSALPIYETRETPDALIVTEEEQPIAPPQEPRQRNDLTVMMAAIVIGLLAMVVTAILVTTGIASESLGIRGPDLEPTLRPLVFGVPTCAAGAGGDTTLVFINNTSAPIDVLEGPQGQETYRMSLDPGQQGTLSTQPGVPVRFAVRALVAGYSGGGATLEVPAGSVCRVPIGE